MSTTTFVKPSLPSAAVRFVGDTIVSVPPSFSQIVAVPLVTNWGPLASEADDGAQLITSFGQWESIYGTDDTPGRTAVLGAFNGMGLAGQGGAGGVQVVRMATGSAARATRTVNNTTPAAAVVITAKYAGTRGNDIGIITEDDPLIVGNDRLRVLYKGATVETYSYPQTAIATLVANIAARPSRWITATLSLGGVALAHVNTLLVGGNDGASVGASQYTAALTALEFAEFDVLSPFNLTDPALKQQVLSWVQGQRDNMRPIRTVLGGLADETVDDAVADAALMPDPHVVRFGVGTLHDDLIGADLSTAQLAPRMAGVLVARGRKSSLTRALLAGLSYVGGNGPTTDDLVVARDGGVTALRRVSSPDADLAVSQGVTTWRASDAAAATGLPYKVFSEPRQVGIMDYYVKRMTQWADDKIIGDLTVTQDTRDTVKAEAISLNDELLRDGLILPGGVDSEGNEIPEPFVNVPDVSGDPDLADSVPYEFGWAFAPTANFVIGNGRVR